MYQGQPAEQTAPRNSRETPEVPFRNRDPQVAVGQPHGALGSSSRIWTFISIRFMAERIPFGSIQAECFERRRLRIAEENRVDVLDDVAGHFEEAALILNRDKGLFRAVIHGDLKRLDERPQAFDMPLNADIAEDEHRRDWRGFLQRGERRDEETEPDLSLDAIVHEIDHFYVEVGDFQFMRD